MSIFSNPFVLYLCKYTVLLKPLDKYWFKYYYVYMFKYLLRRHPVINLIVYCKDHCRQPVRFGFPPPLRDIQADIPKSWCCLCGSEVFERGQDRCIRCRGAKGANR